MLRFIFSQQPGTVAPDLCAGAHERLGAVAWTKVSFSRRGWRVKGKLGQRAMASTRVSIIFLMMWAMLVVFGWYLMVFLMIISMVFDGDDPIFFFQVLISPCREVSDSSRWWSLGAVPRAPGSSATWQVVLILSNVT